MGKNLVLKAIRQFPIILVGVVQGALRFSGILVCVVTFFIVQFCIRLIPIPSIRKPLPLRLNTFYAKLVLFILGIPLCIEGKMPNTKLIIIANHWSWLDPIAMSALGPVRFLTSEQTKSHPFLGWITTLASCQFVQRTPWTLKNEIAQSQNLNQKDSIAFYPEATSSNGMGLLPFHSAFFEVAIQNNTPILPILLHWSQPEIAWYGNMNFAPHFFQTLFRKPSTLFIKILDPIPVQSNDTRKSLCTKAWCEMNDCYTSWKINSVTQSVGQPIRTVLQPPSPIVLP